MKGSYSLREDTLLNRLRRWQRGETPGPWNVVFFPTNRCNLNCIMCWRTKLTFDPHDEVPDERFISMVDELAELGCREWVIVGGGEPLIRVSLVMEMAERLCRHGIKGILQNNGTLMKAEYARKLVDIGFNSLVCSLDGPTAEINDAIRGKGTFDRATAAMAYCAGYKREAGVNNPYLTLFVTLTRHNHDVLPAMVELAARIGCNCVMGAPAVGPWCTEHLMTPEQVQAVPELVAKAINRGRDLGIDLNVEALSAASFSPPWRNWLFDAVLGKHEWISNALCFDAWHTIGIFPDGRIGPCCSGWHAEAPKVTDGSMKRLWTGPYFTEIRRKILHRETLDFCHLCPPLLASRTATMRHPLRLMDAAEDWPALAWREKAFVRGWRATGCLLRRDIAGAFNAGFRSIS